MKNLILRFLLGILAVVPAVAKEKESPKDFVEVTNHSALGALTSRGSSTPDRVGIKLEVKYGLISQQEGVVSLALDDVDEMKFTTFDSATVSSGSGVTDMKASARLIQRQSLHAIVVLKKKDAKPGEQPLAMTGFTIDLTKLKR